MAAVMPFDRAGLPCLAILCLLLHLSSVSVSAKWVRSSIDTRDDWAFISRFCFLSEDGGFDYVFKYPRSYGTQQLLLYYDAPGQWESVYQSSKNCSTRLSVLSKANNQIIDLTNETNTGSRWAGCEVISENGQDYFNCTDRVSFRASRERWWYIAVARCDSSLGGVAGLQLEYEIHMTNGEPGDFLHYELSADEFYILPVDIAFLLIYFILLIISIVCAVVLYNRSMLHTTYKMYITSVCLWLFGLLLQCIAWGRYGDSGWEEGSTEVTGRLFLAASTTVFLLMLILMAKGYTITRGRLTQMSAIRLTVFLCLYIISNITLFIWEGVFFDEGLVLYFYESPPGYGLICMRLIGWLWFLYAFCFTMKHHPDKASFYVPFFIYYTVWFWAGPVVILIAIFAMAKWSRQKTVNGVENFVALCGHLFFLVLTRPSAANKNFPYHLRVSQVRFSDDDSEPTEMYALSEESRRHLDSIFVVHRIEGQQSSSLGAPAHLTSNGSHSNGYPKMTGEVNHGYMRTENGYHPSLEHLFTAQKNGQLPPLSANMPSIQNGHQLPPLQSQHALPPLQSQHSLPPLQSQHSLPPLQSQHALPPLPDDKVDAARDTGGDDAAERTTLKEEGTPGADTNMEGTRVPKKKGRKKKRSRDKDNTTQSSSKENTTQQQQGLPPIYAERSKLPPLHSGALPSIKDSTDSL